MTLNQKSRLKNNNNKKNINKYNKLKKINKYYQIGKVGKIFKNTQIRPQLKGLTIKIFTMTPKKPNSALRKVAKVKLNKPLKNGEKYVIAYIPGEKHTLTLHNLVLLIPKKTKDLPGIRYKILRGVLDAKPPIRNTKRSKYGKKK